MLRKKGMETGRLLIMSNASNTDTTIANAHNRATVGNPVVTTHKRYFGPPPFWQTIWAGENTALFWQVQTPE